MNINVVKLSLNGKSFHGCSPMWRTTPHVRVPGAFGSAGDQVWSSKIKVLCIRGRGNDLGEATVGDVVKLPRAPVRLSRDQ